MSSTTHRSIHIPYWVDEATDRNHFFENHWKRVALELLANHEPQLTGMTLLDYGCGRGETLEYASSYGMEPTGMDVDPECVRIASGLGKAELLDLANAAQQVGVGTFDIVTCFHVLEHVDNPKQVLTMLRHAARRYVVTAVPNLRLISNLRQPRREGGRVNEGHLQNWDHSHLLNLAERHCGLKLVEWTFDHVKLPIVSNQLCKLCGRKAAIHFETGLFKRLFPFQSTSIIGLFRVV